MKQAEIKSGEQLVRVDLRDYYKLFPKDLFFNVIRLLS